MDMKITIKCLYMYMPKTVIFWGLRFRDDLRSMPSLRDIGLCENRDPSLFIQDFDNTPQNSIRALRSLDVTSCSPYIVKP